MHEPQAPGRRWWQYKRTWLIGLPAALVLGVVGLFVWGSLQPKPAGFAPTDSDQAVASSQVAAPSQEAVPSEETVSPEEAVTSEEWIRYTVDAKSKQDWVLFDFDQGRVVDGDFTAPDWDVAFKRTKLLTNSGVTNPSGPGGAYDLGEVLLEDAMPPESVVFVVDILGGEDEDEPENPAIGGWYKYSFIKHVVSVKPNTYLVRTGEDSDALVQFDSYYCEDEEAACITFRYRLIPRVADASSDASS
ncbi:MAG: hypothetical protein BMS9Abin20_0698 [Acidimicrobiia bacterium]|nr:MAG: hypothetical protein BMS9Abin20_0698 [Acidimicrobiia bacterium]